MSQDKKVVAETK
jgi:hypothetical protein